MIDWLREDRLDPKVEVAGRKLPIAIRRHARARRLTMRLAPDGSEVRITLPTWGRTIDAITFANARVEWLTQQLDRQPEAVNIAPGSAFAFRGQQLMIAWNKSAPRTPYRDGASIVVGGPEDRIVPRLRRWLEGEALALARADLAFYCKRDGREAPDLKLSRAQRRWGSCSGTSRETRTIRINWRLVMAPDAVRRSVVAHEVAHLTHFDHSPAFHRLLRNLFEGDLAAADGWLREQGRSLYVPFG